MTVLQLQDRVRSSFFRQKSRAAVGIQGVIALLYNPSVVNVDITQALFTDLADYLVSKY